MFQTHHEKIARKSRIEIERITFLLNKYSNDCKCSFEDSLSFTMGEMGYRKINYILCQKEDIFIISQLSAKYMKVYGIHYERFVQSVFECYDYCSKSGYSSNVNQATLKLGE